MIKPRIVLSGIGALATVFCAGWLLLRLHTETQYMGREGVVFQRGATDCGGAALKMIFDRFGITMDYGQLLSRLKTGATGTAMLNMKEVAEAEGLLCAGWRLAPRDLPVIPLPAILLIRTSHFVVMDSPYSAQGILVLDPARGRLRLSMHKLLSVWNGESLLFCKPGVDSDRHGRWFGHSQFKSRRNLP